MSVLVYLEVSDNNDDSVSSTGLTEKFDWSVCKSMLAMVDVSFTTHAL